MLQILVPMSFDQNDDFFTNRHLCIKYRIFVNFSNFQIFIVQSQEIRMLRKMTSFCIQKICQRAPEVFTRTKKIITHLGDQVLCDFSLINDPKTSIESMIILNNQLNLSIFNKCAPLTENIVLADGGANHFFDTDFRDSENVRAVVGDFDCINDDVLEYYNSKKIPIEYISTLEDNDFCKSLEKCINQKWNTIFCFGAFGGRMDQTLSGMHYCEKYCKMYPELEIMLMGQSNMMFHLKKNVKYRIRITEDLLSRFGCGIITFGKAEHVQTTGFKWNLGRDYKYSELEWGSVISTSNQMIEDQCTIQSSCDIFFVANYSKKMRQ